MNITGASNLFGGAVTEDSPTQVEFSREEFWGTWQDWLVWLPTFVGPPWLAVWAMEKFSLFDGDDPLFVIVALGVAIVFFIAVRKWVWKQPWAKHLPGLAYGLWIGVAMLGGSAALGTVYFLNAALDSGKATENRYPVIKADRGGDDRFHPPQVLLMSDGPKPISLCGRCYVKVARVGSIAILRVRPGFFGRPWIENVAFVDTWRSVDASAPASAGQRLGTIILATIAAALIWFSGRKKGSAG